MFLRCNIPVGAVAGIMVAVGLGGAAVAADASFLQEVSDMPLPVGLVEDRQAGVAFDKPGGRIVEAVARGHGSARAVADFYRDALPELGWRAVETGDALTWRREGEALRLEVAEADSLVTVRFYLTPE